MMTSELAPGDGHLISGGWMPPEEPEGTLMPLRPTVAMLREQAAAVVKAVRVNGQTVDALAHSADTEEIGLVLAIGSGDSLGVAEAAVWDFTRHAGLPGTAMQAQEYSSRGHRLENTSSLRIAISATGRDSEATDALVALRSRPGRIVMVSDAPPDSPYSDLRKGEVMLRTHARSKQPHIPSATTLSAYAVLLDAALALGSQGLPADSFKARLFESVRSDILRNPRWMKKLSADGERWALDVVKRIPDCGAIALLGEGLDRIAARMGDSLMAGGPQIYTAHHILAEQDHAFRLRPLQAGQPVVIMATEGVTPYHERLFEQLERSDRFPILIGNPHNMSPELGDHPNVFPSHDIPRIVNVIGGVIILQWLAVAIAARRVEEGHERYTSADVMDAETRYEHIKYWRGGLVGRDI